VKKESAEYWIEKLALKRHPEGGFYKEIYRSEELIPSDALPVRYTGIRSYSTSIYFLLEKNDFSAFHRLRSDEIWHFYEGGPCELHILTPEGELLHQVLGRDIETDQHFQVVVPKECWFAANPKDGSDYSFVGCTMAPGFSFEDFELADYEVLSGRYPEHREIFRMYIRK